MAQSRQAIQTRIASVDSTKKITRAMQMVASSKLTKERRAMEENRPYARALKELMTLTLQSIGTSSKWMKENEGKPTYLFVITSDMGLCGGYNANIYRELETIVQPGDRIVMAGSRGAGWASARKIELEDILLNLNDDIAYLELGRKAEEALDLFERREIKDIKILYTQYKNTLTFVPVLETILPIARPAEKSVSKGQAVTIFEPDREEMLSEIIPLAVKNVLFSDYLESKTSEQASRRMAMESATDNATELQEQLELEYNRIRQGAITQEITEIVGGANALQ